MESYFFFIFIICIFVIWLGSTRAKRLGVRGEHRVSDLLNRLPKDKYIVLNDLLINNEYGTSQIDHVVLSIYGIFVIETKNYSGMIYGGEKSDQWTKNMYGNKYSFRNPIKQNFGHVKALSNKLNIPISAFTPIVVFTSRAELKGDFKSTVIYTNQLLKEIEFHNTIKFSKEQINSYYQMLNSFTYYTNDQRNEHIDEIQRNASKYKESVSKGICPKCGGQLKIRKSKYGAFYGCSNYPKCKFIVNNK